MSDFKYEPAETYELLLRQANAMALMIRSMEKRSAFKDVNIATMTRELALQGFEEINAQRETNAILTNHIQSLEAELEKLKRVHELYKAWIDSDKPLSHIIEENAELRSKLALAEQSADRAIKGWNELKTENAELRREVEKYKKAVNCVWELITESEGVYGLHLNGDFAPWSELMDGGRFMEWLSDYEDALDKGE